MAAYQTPIIRTFAAERGLDDAVALSGGQQEKPPTILFLVCASSRFVPGAAIHYTAYNFFTWDRKRWRSQYGMDTIKMAIAIGLGI